jgi:hypothetical protein
MKTKGGAAEITEDAGVLKNYIDPKDKKGKKEKKEIKEKKKAKKPKKVKAKNELRPDLYKDEKKGEKPSGDEKEKKRDGFESSSPVDVNERARQGIEQAQSRRTPTTRTPVHMAKLVFTLCDLYRVLRDSCPTCLSNSRDFGSYSTF